MARRLLLEVVNISYHGLFFVLKRFSSAEKVLLNVRVVLSLLNEGCSQGIALSHSTSFKIVFIWC